MIKIDKAFCNEVDKVSSIIEKKYFSVIIGILIMEGPKFFNEFKRDSNISAKTLSLRLNELVELNVIGNEIIMKGAVKMKKYYPLDLAFKYYEVMKAMVKWSKLVK